MKYYLSIYRFSVSAFSALSGKSLFILKLNRYSLVFSCRSIINLAFTLVFDSDQMDFVLFVWDRKSRFNFFPRLWIFNGSSSSWWKEFNFPIQLHWHFCLKSVGLLSAGLFLDFLLCSVDPFVMLYTKTTTSY